MSVFLSWARSALMGLAVGGAVDATDESKWVGTFGSITDMMDGGLSLLKPGQRTDDTSMTLCIADSLLAQGRCDSFDVMDRCQRRLSEGYRSPTSRCSDIGGQVRTTLFDFEHDPRVPVIAERTTSAGNGMIMRLVLMVIVGFRSRPLREVVAAVRLSVRETHFSIEAETVTEVFAVLLVGALLGWSSEQLVDVFWTSTGQPFSEVAAQVISPDPRVRAPWEAETSGYIVNGPRLAVYGLLDSPSFKDTTLAIANTGGSSGTSVTIYGQLDGVFYGIEAIPASWRERIYQGEGTDELTYALVGLQLEVPVTRFGKDLQDEIPSA